ncbi:MAG: hypothetical protein JSS82_05340 [Bacteroidetes bacterium]|nr:hypothetical protein [Bacteroidota bacterium]
MKNLFLFICLLTAPTLFSFKGDIHKACDILTADQVYNVIGYPVKEEATADKKTCLYKTENGFIKIAVSYMAYKDPEAAFQALKKQHAENLAHVKKGEMVENTYNVLGTVPEAKPDDYYMMGDGSMAEGPNAVSFRFMVGKYVIMLNTRGIMKTILVPKLGAVYNTVLKNAGSR